MKVSKEKLKQMIKEELEKVMKEAEADLEEAKMTDDEEKKAASNLAHDKAKKGMMKHDLADKEKAAKGKSANPVASKERPLGGKPQLSGKDKHYNNPTKSAAGTAKGKGLAESEENLEEAWEDNEAEDFPADHVGSSNRPVWGPKDGGANDFGMGADDDLAAAAKAEKGKDLSHDDLYRGNDDSTYALDRLVGKTLPFYGLKVNGEQGGKGSLTAVDEADNLEFALGNTIYRAVAGADWGKDWVDGIRQSGRIKAKGLKPEAVVKVEKGSFGAFDGFKLVDEKTGKPVALIGTDNSDSYYPLVVFTSDPTDIENVLDNGGVAGLDEMENLRESFRRFTKLPKAVLKD